MVSSELGAAKSLRSLARAMRIDSVRTLGNDCRDRLFFDSLRNTTSAVLSHVSIPWSISAASIVTTGELAFRARVRDKARACVTIDATCQCAVSGGISSRGRYTPRRIFRSCPPAMAAGVSRSPGPAITRSSRVTFIVLLHTTAATSAGRTNFLWIKFAFAQMWINLSKGCGAEAGFYASTCLIGLLSCVLHAQLVWTPTSFVCAELVPALSDLACIPSNCVRPNRH